MQPLFGNTIPSLNANGAIILHAPMAQVTQMSAMKDEDKPPSYHGETVVVTTSKHASSSVDEKIITVDDAIDSIGFGKFQRRVLWAAGLW